MARPPSGDAELEHDPLEVPDYVGESLRAWCEYDRRRRDAHQELRSELEVMGQAPCYDPYSDPLDEPFPEERW